MSNNNATDTRQFLPFVSIVVPIWNGAAHLPGLVSSLAALDYPQDRLEFIFVDNRSTDDTMELLQELHSSDSLPGLTILQESRIQTSYAARNMGIQHGTAEIIAFTDVDCRPQQDWLKELVAPFADSRIGITVGTVSSHPGTTLLERYATTREVLSHKGTLRHEFLPFGGTLNLAVRRSVFRQIGLFIPHIDTAGDAEFCWRMQQESNWQVHAAAGAEIEHSHRRELKDLRDQVRRYGRARRYRKEMFAKERHPLTILAKRIPHSFRSWTRQEIPLAAHGLARGEMQAGLFFLMPLLDLLLGIDYLVAFYASKLPEQAATSRIQLTEKKHAPI